MTHDRSSRLEMDRRRWLKLGATSFVAASLPRTLLGAQPTPQACSPPIPLNHEPSNGGPCPYRFLGSTRTAITTRYLHAECRTLAHLSLQGKLARCNGFHGMGTDNRGNRLAWGAPTTDYSYMAGEYWAARQPHQAVFAHT
jgi:hypothetical protein